MKKTLSGRVTEIDLLRGIAVILMVFDHTVFDIFGLMPYIFSDFPRYGEMSMKIYDMAQSYWTCDIRIVIRYVFLAVFLGLTGVCCSFSHSNLKRGLKLMCAALALTAVTYVVGIVINDCDIMITFGVLHCMSLALIIIGLLEKVVKNKYFYLAAGVAAVAVGIILNSGVPRISYKDGNIFVLICRQIIGTCECGGDCFPFLLFGGQVFIGVFIGKLVYRNKKSIFGKREYSNNVVTFIGRNSLAVYFGQQAVTPLIMGLALLFCGFHLNL